MAPTLTDGRKVSLEDRYMDEGGDVFLTGIQAIVRMMLDQQRRDAAAGLRTAAFVSGYEGSPLGGLDLELGRRRALLDEHHVVHRPAVNEELAASSVSGSQMAGGRADARYDGVVGYWYGKAPGLDRAGDAIRHANLTGTHHRGGAVALVGDDPLSKSSSVPSASEAALADLGLPTLYPSTPEEIIDFGLQAVALSRASGLWSALKIVTNVADGGGDVRLLADRPAPAMPELTDGGRPFRHVVDAKLIGPVPVEAERTAFGIRLDVAREFARLNPINSLESHGAADRIGIVAAGKTYMDLCQALDRLGLDPEARAKQGIRVLKLGMIFPLEPSIVAECAAGLETIVVVEEKRSFLEAAFKCLLYGRVDAPAIVGKHDREGGRLFSPDAELDPDKIAAPLADLLSSYEGLEDLPRRLRQRSHAVLAPDLPAGASASRTPYFCSGCPHSRSTKAPDGSVVGGGIGCHGMVLLMDPERVGDVLGLIQMGGEGTPWIGMEPFVETSHLLQNIGDGTFHHSGSLAVRAAVAAGSNITFKLLYNSAVAMTGGQHAVGQRSIAELTRLLESEGVARTIVTTEEPRRYRKAKLAAGVEVWSRDRLQEAQTELAKTAGVTVLIHDQQCATEKRRQLKRNPPTSPARRVLINERVCEGCGDCGAKSNCLSVEPIDTEYGRKTRIHQGSCNTDYACLDGDCPSFITVTPAKPKRRKKGDEQAGPDTARGTAAAPPTPLPKLDGEDFTIRFTGIGGTGIVTVAQIVANAAFLAGRHVKTLDQTGLSQKAGPVVSDVKIAGANVAAASKLSRGECDLYLACDPLVGADPKNLEVADPRRTVAVVSSSKVPTGNMVVDVDQEFPDLTRLIEPIKLATRGDAQVVVDGRRLAEEHFGGDQYANVLMLGAAYQSGGLPLPLDAIESAIELNGVRVEENRRAFELGRRAACGMLPEPPRQPTAPDRRAAKQAAAGSRLATTVRSEPGGELAAVVLDRSAELVGYQSAAYARSYLQLVERVRAAEAACLESEALALAVARNLYKLMAYKDEYEVARLSLDPALRRQVEARFGPGARYRHQLHPPVLRALGMKRKIGLGAWAKPLFHGLRGARRLRGTKLDPFGMTEVRQVERGLVAEYREVVGELIAGLSPDNHALALKIAELPDLVRGYEQIKLESVARYEERLAALREEFSTAGL